ncbi:tyrosine-type recombinase/integrase [Bengtsoniella intestinalis]|uniref:site-specific integrase n=1 Tax=Bengtsoniella intestinalis TaxID=3073143 RepID=UPI00391EEB8B
MTKKKNRWYIHYYIGKDATGKWKRKWEGSWSTKREAERILRTRIQELENAPKAPTITGDTMEQYLTGWIDGYCTINLAPNTLNSYRTNVRKHMLPYIGHIPLQAIKPAEIQQLYTTLTDKGLSKTSVRYIHNNLHKAFATAVKQELIPRNPTDFVDPPRVNHYEATTLSPTDTLTLLEGCRGQPIYLPVFLAVTLGLRRGEVLALQWDDVDMHHATLTVRHSALFTEDGFSLQPTKTKNSRRTLLIPQALMIALESALSKQQDIATIAGRGYNPYNLVCCREDGTPLTTNALQHRFKDALEQAQLPPIRFHDLRHTNATLMLRNAVPAKIVSSMLGHSSIGITLDTYSHVVTEMQEGAVGVMDGILAPLNHPKPPSKTAPENA